MSNDKPIKNIKPTTIIIGAGASADFCAKKQQDILAEISQGENGQLVKKPEFKSENQIAMPTGEKLVSLMEGFKDEIPELFLYDYLEKKVFKNKEKGYKMAAKDMLHHFAKKLVNIAKEGGVGTAFANISLREGGNKLQEYLNDTHQDILAASFKTECGEILEKMRINYPIKLSGIIDLIVSDKKFAKLQKYLDIGKLIHFYDPPSIDFFLSSIKEEKIDISVEGVKSKKDDLLSAGKELIAYYLLKAEDTNTFKSSNKIWYRWLRNEIVRLGKTPKEIEERLKKINIISFNYDRSLEAYLDEKLLPEYRDQIKSKIIYPYGSLNCFKDICYGRLKKEFELAKSGNAEESIKSIKFISSLFLDGKLAQKVNDEKSGIFVVDDERTTQKEDAQKIIKEKSEKIYFFGFAFLKENMDFLGFEKNDLLETKELFYTNYSDSKKIKRIFNSFFRPYVDSNGQFTDNDSPSRTSSSKGVCDAIEQDFDLNFE